jgi:hypothetical protein
MESSLVEKLLVESMVKIDLEGTHLLSVLFSEELQEGELLNIYLIES